MLGRECPACGKILCFYLATYISCNIPYTIKKGEIVGYRIAECYDEKCGFTVKTSQWSLHDDFLSRFREKEYSDLLDFNY